MPLRTEPFPDRNGGCVPRTTTRVRVVEGSATYRRRSAAFSVLPYDIDKQETERARRARNRQKGWGRPKGVRSRYIDNLYGSAQKGGHYEHRGTGRVS